MLDSDLAALYGVDTRSLVQAVKRNLDRFPADLMFQLTDEEAALLRSQMGISRSSHGGSSLAASASGERSRPFPSGDQATERF
jgi:hypothetical protein